MITDIYNNQQVVVSQEMLPMPPLASDPTLVVALVIRTIGRRGAERHRIELAPQSAVSLAARLLELAVPA